MPDSTGNTNPNQNAQPTIEELTASQVNNPSLPQGTVVTPVLQTENDNELVTNQPKIDAKQITGAAPVVAQTAQAAQANAVQADAEKYRKDQEAAMANSGYQAEMIGDKTPQVTAQQGTVSKESTVQGQLESLTNFDPKTGPAWGKAAWTGANEAMAARGLGASSIAGAAITQAIMEAAIPIATTDAQIFAAMDLKNLDNRQQAELANVEMRHKSMLSDQAMKNAEKQFNATDRSQLAQFFTGIMADIDKANMQSANEVAVSNAQTATNASIASMQSANQVAVSNAERADAIAKSNAERDDAMAQFFAKNQLVVDQSNAEWRRNINTSNTAAVNAANQVNATNLLGISNTAMNNLWQASRDQAHWLWQSSENAQDRALNLTLAAFNRDTQFNLMNEADRNQMFQSLGGFVLDIISGLVGR